MYKFDNKFLNIFVNFLLVIWQLPQVIIGLIMLLVFRNKTTYTNPYNHITVWNINSGKTFGTACFSTGPIIITCEGASENTLRHETGHSAQSVRLSWLFHIVVSIPSICRFWYRRIFNKSKEWYHNGSGKGILAGYPEHWADVLGGVGKEIENK